MDVVFTETIGPGSLDIFSGNLATAFRRHFPDRVRILTSDVSRKSADVFGVPYNSAEAAEADLQEWKFLRLLKEKVLPGTIVNVSNQHMARCVPELKKRHVIVTDHDAVARAWDAFDSEHTPYIGLPNKRDLVMLKRDIEGLQKAAHIITVSQLSKIDLQRRWGIAENKISVVYEGINTDIFRPSVKRFVLDGPYILFVATEDWRKNIEVVLRALRCAKYDLGVANLRLVKVGDAGPGGRVEGGLRANTFRLMGELGVREGDDIVFTGYVSQEDLPSLYAGAVALVHPSRYEGFGFPPLEAMACGTMAIVSKGTALEEVSGEASLVVYPDDWQGLATIIKHLVDDSSFRGEYVAKGSRHVRRFTWARTAAKTLEVYQSVHKRLMAAIAMST